LGTAGPIKLAEKYLTEGNESQMFFMFNSDVICEYPLEDMIAFHKAHGKEGTIMGTPVEDPSRFGVIVSHEDGQIEKFVEKP
jgi:mannose-1-phosphate guanylyltransferase